MRPAPRPSRAGRRGTGRRAPSPRPSGPRTSRLANARDFALFGGVPLFAFLTVTVASFAVGIVLTLTNWNGLNADLSFAGLANYRDAVTDSGFWASLWLTTKYTVLVVALANALGFALAYALSGRIKLRGLLRAGFFTPNLIGGIVLGFIFYFVFSQAVVAIGQGLKIAALSSSWLASPGLAFWALVIATAWQIAGFLMVIYLAGLTTLPSEVMEAASVDGAGGWRRLVSVTLPLMRPSFTICVFLTIGRSFMTYDLNLALTKGDPYGSTVLAAMYVYRKAFTAQEFSVGQAQALVLFVIVSAVALTQVALSRRGEVDL
jgi:raffinose/stachyose/melibiose transport system permease protein